MMPRLAPKRPKLDDNDDRPNSIIETLMTSSDSIAYAIDNCVASIQLPAFFGTKAEHLKAQIRQVLSDAANNRQNKYNSNPEWYLVRDDESQIRLINRPTSVISSGCSSISEVKVEYIEEEERSDEEPVQIGHTVQIDDVTGELLCSSKQSAFDNFDLFNHVLTTRQDLHSFLGAQNYTERDQAASLAIKSYLKFCHQTNTPQWRFTESLETTEVVDIVKEPSFKRKNGESTSMLERVAALDAFKLPQHRGKSMRRLAEVAQQVCNLDRVPDPTTVKRWIRKEDELRRQALAIKESTNGSTIKVKNIQSPDVFNFTETLCAHLTRTYVGQCLTIEMMVEKARRLAKEKFPNIKLLGRPAQTTINRKFISDLCRKKNWTVNRQTGKIQIGDT